VTERVCTNTREVTSCEKKLISNDDSLLTNTLLLLQETPTRCRQDLIVVRLERQPAFLWCADLLVRELGFFFGDERPLVSATALSGVDEQLCVA
jgi:hypothetical protein